MQVVRNRAHHNCPRSQMRHCRTISVEDGPVEFAEEGQGPAIVYFHGTPGGCEVVFPMERELLDVGFRLIVPNRPGNFGTTLGGRTSSVDCARLAAAVLDSLGIAKVGVIGTSAGGPAALSFAALFPERQPRSSYNARRLTDGMT